jgi:putative lipoprotein
MIRRILLIAASAALSLALALPGAHAAEKKPAEPMAIPAIISGTVAYRERMALPPGSEAIVQLLDTSRADAPAIVVAEQRIAIAGQVPVSYQLDYDAVTINPRNSYTVSARIVNGSKLLFITDTATPAITRGSPGHVDLMLKKVSAPQK